jgi:hypothetical protein
MFKRFWLNIYNRMVEWAWNCYWYDADHGNRRLVGWIEKKIMKEQG